MLECRQDFKEIGLLGQGNFSKVFRARHRFDGREYAVKRTQRAAVPDGSSFAQFIQVGPACSSSRPSAQWVVCWKQGRRCCFCCLGLELQQAGKAKTELLMCRMCEGAQWLLHPLWCMPRRASVLPTCRIPGLQEAQVLAHLPPHPHIVQYFSCWSEPHQVRARVCFAAQANSFINLILQPHLSPTHDWPVHCRAASTCTCNWRNATSLWAFMPALGSSSRKGICWRCCDRWVQMMSGSLRMNVLHFPGVVACVSSCTSHQILHCADVPPGGIGSGPLAPAWRCTHGREAR